MKTTVEISDAPLVRARRQGRLSGRPLRSLIEEGLRLVLQAESTRTTYRLPSRNVGKAGGPNPLARLSWQDLRDHVYGGR